THFSKATAEEIEARADSKSFHKNLRARRFNKVKNVNRHFPISPAFERFGGHLTSWKFTQMEVV
ncbi:hypothetical protein, partial [Flavobacterium sp.]|uniref:hypothetical protein n=1 Tax=Flavobacterium sp. TaxID=239 RepID=UPI0025C51D91